MARAPGGTSAWEWAAAAVSAVLVAAMVAFLVGQGLTSRGATPEIAVRASDVARVGRQYRVEFRVRNTGGATASGLNVQGELREGAEVVETSDVTLDYVPPGADQTAVLWFTRDPLRHHLELRATGHDMP